MPSTIGLRYDNTHLSPSWGACDLTFDGDDALVSAALISLFTWRRGSPEEADDAGRRYGWWGGPIGSRLWTLSREKVLPGIVPRVRDIMSEALQWMIDDGVVTSMEMEAEIRSRDDLYVRIAMIRDGRVAADLQFANVWSAIQ
jgi:phage gp46-like protein